MSLRSVYAAVLCCLFPGNLLAEPVQVQSGEHANFTRLVATIPTGARWEVRQMDREVVLQVREIDDGFDTSDVFRLIPRTRVSAVNSGPDRLTLTLACDCRAAAFLEDGRHIVMDVAAKDTRLAVPFVPFETAKPANPSATKTARPTLPPPKSGQTTRDLVQSFDRSPLSPQAQAALQEMQQRLASEITAAASRGLLEEIDAAPPRAPRKKTDNKPATPMAEPLTGLSSNMRVSSSMDLPPGRRDDLHPLSMGGIDCIPDAEVALSQWGGNGPVPIQIAAARDGLWDTAGKLSEAKALTLARLYLHLGFGAEAAALLSQLQNAPPPLLTLAQILAGKHAAQAPLLSQQRTCKGDISLWGMLATPLPFPPPLVDPGPPLIALTKLPLHLRRLVAPALSERFLSNGNPNAAAATLRSIERAKKQGDLPAPARLARAGLSLQAGRQEEGTAALSVLAGEGRPESPAALVALVDARLASDQAIDPETAQLVAAYAYELRNTPLGADLRRAHVLALLKSGQFDSAFSAARQLGAEVEEERAIALRLQLIADLVENASDIVFLEHILRQDRRDVARLPRKDQLDTLNRLLTLGFAQQAQNLLRVVPERPRQDDRQLLAARIALALDQPMLARAALIEIPGEAAQDLRARAQIKAGNHAEAYRLYQTGPPPRDLQRISWLVEQTLDEGLEADPVFAPMVTLSNRPVTPPEPGNGMLSGSSDLITASTEARTTLSTFLGSSELAVPAGTSP